MEIEVSEKAQEWFKEEMGIPEGKGIRFLGKVYGNSQIHEGFSIAIEVDAPSEPIAMKEINGVAYFVEAADDWFFHGYDLEVGFDENQKEPEYIFHEQQK